MYDVIVKTKKEEKIGDIKTQKAPQQIKTPAPKAQIIVVLTIVVMILGFIALDMFVFKSPSVIKAQEVRQKSDSLELLLINKIPQIDNAIKIQEQQLKDLKDITNN